MEEQFYCVTIDLDALRARLGYGTREETVSWLKLVGFTGTRWPGVFIGDPDAIEELEENEVICVKPMGP
ncbi:MAG TPA: hypothetical protein VGR35_19865 [Tepidisphaeraceae bacterium]|nr:hypothetical protein [Tepidisphaeraceae bacterium]